MRKNKLYIFIFITAITLVSCLSLAGCNQNKQEKQIDNYVQKKIEEIGNKYPTALVFFLLGFNAQTKKMVDLAEFEDDKNPTLKKIREKKIELNNKYNEEMFFDILKYYDFDSNKKAKVIGTNKNLKPIGVTPTSNIITIAGSQGLSTGGILPDEDETPGNDIIIIEEIVDKWKDGSIDEEDFISEDEPEEDILILTGSVTLQGSLTDGSESYTIIINFDTGKVNGTWQNIGEYSTCTGSIDGTINKQTLEINAVAPGTCNDGESTYDAFTAPMKGTYDISTHSASGTISDMVGDTYEWYAE